jgi:hypothetical protein
MNGAASAAQYIKRFFDLGRYFMYTAKTSATFLLCLLLFFAAIPAHGAQQDTQSRAAMTPDVTIIIEQEKVRLTARQAVEYLQLQIQDPTGEVIFDSGPVQGNEIAWPFQNGAGEAVKSGLYAYRLTVKEADKETARTRRGHFIVDRAKDREGGADKLWVTSQTEGGVGTELTVARDEDGAIAGTKAGVKGSGAALMAEEIPEGQVVKKLNGLTDDVTLEAGINVAITPNGNTLKIDAPIADGQVVKGLNGLTDQVTLEAGPNITITPNGNTLTIAATGVGNSSITELNGNVGIGTTNPALLSGGAGRLLSISDRLNPGVALTNTGAGGNQFFLYSFAGGSAGSGSFRIYDATNRADRFVLTHSGSIGIGTTNPTGNLEIAGYSPFITLRETQQGRNEPAYIQNSGGSLVFKPTGSGYNTAAMVMQANTLNVGIGSTNPQAKLEVASGSGDILRLIGYEPFITLFDSRSGYTPTYIQNAGGNLVFKPSGFGSCCAAMVMQANTGNVGIGTSAPQAKLDVVGQTRTQSLQITGGADFAENFDVNVETTGDEELAAKVEAGMVVSIDPTSPGKLRLSAQAYDRRVAGIISGAGGVKPGMMMSQEGTLADGKHPVALSGRVYVWADASQGAIEPGELLTTSATPGHAMKVEDATKAQGAIIGKAMTGLKNGKGLVLALVTLQ